MMKLDWKIVNYIRSLYCTTDMTLREIANNASHRAGFKIDYRKVHKLVKNYRWHDPNYLVPKKQRSKITPEIKTYILNSDEYGLVLSEKIYDKFNVRITSSYINKIKHPEQQYIEMIMG